MDMEKPHPIRMGQILIGLYQRSSPPRTSAHMTITAADPREEEEAANGLFTRMEDESFQFKHLAVGGRIVL